MHIVFKYKGNKQPSTGAIFPNQLPNSRRVIAKVLYGSSMVKELVLISIDDGRACLPIPNGGPSAVAKHDAAIARLLSVGNFDDYLQKAGLVIV